MNHSEPRLAITMGDPAGIGPEIVVKALAQATALESAIPVVVGDLAVLGQATEITGTHLIFRERSASDAFGREGSAIDVIDLRNVDAARLKRGEVSAQAGKAAFEYVETATRLALSGSVGGVVTAPLNKEALALAGHRGVGHTELIAEFCGVPRSAVAMMLASDRLRVVHVSTHVPLSRAVQLVETDRIVRVAKLAAVATSEIVGRPPRIAIAGLNPHAGEHGLFGSEDEEQIAPAVKRLRVEGFDVAGPIPPDTVFMRATEGHFDVVIAMYHDQGHIPSKLVGLSETVNVTLGLPVIRTSVDHGTAFDIAGTGTADATNLVVAYRLAARMATRRSVGTANMAT